MHFCPIIINFPHLRRRPLFRVNHSRYMLASYNHVFPLPLTIHPWPIISGTRTHSNHHSCRLGCKLRPWMRYYIYIFVCVCVCVYHNNRVGRWMAGTYKSLNDSARDPDVWCCVVCSSASSIKFGRPMDSIMPFTLQQMCGKRGGLMHSTVTTSVFRWE